MKALAIEHLPTPKQFEIFINNAPVAIAMLDTRMCYLAVSPRWLSYHGCPEADFHGRCHYDVVPDIPDRWKEVHRRCLAGATENAAEDRFDRADGTIKWLRWEIQPWHESSGAIGGLVVFVEDITKRKLEAEALRKSEQMLRITFDLSPCGMVRVDLHERFIEVNEKYCQITGYSAEELSQITISDLTHPEDRLHEAEPFGAYLSGAMPFYETEKRYIRKDGGIRWVSVTVRMLRDSWIISSARRGPKSTAALNAKRRILGGRLSASIAFQ